MKPGPASHSPGDDVTSAAESLLGIDLSASQLPSAPIDLDDADLFGEPEPPAREEEQPPREATPEVAKSVFPPAAPDDDFGSDFGAGLDALPEPVAEPIKHSAPPAPAKAAVPARAKVTSFPAVVESSADEPFAVEPFAEKSAAVTSSSDEPLAEEPFAEESTAEELPVETAVPAAGRDDSYWDALEGWDWGEESGGGKSDASSRDEGPRRRDQGRPRGRSGGRSERPREERTAPATPPRARSAPAVDDFGSGIDDEPTVEQRESEPAPDVSIFDLRPTESQVRQIEREREPPRRREPPVSRPAPPPAEDSGEGDEFGAGLVEPPAGAGRRSEERAPAPEPTADAEGRDQRRGRRRRGRGRRREAEGGEAVETRPPVGSRHEPEPVIDDVDEGLPPEDFTAEGDLEVQESRFQDVPTWAEAIALLVKTRVGGESSGGDRGRSRGDSSESGERGGGRGRGRGGRRGGGGGRRRSE